MTFLKVLQPGATTPPLVSTARAVAFEEGFYAEEQQEGHPFRWMGRHASLRLAPDPNPLYVEVGVLSEFHDLSQSLIVRAGDRVERCTLVHGWSSVSVALPAGIDRVDLEVDRIFPREYHPSDSRMLGVRVRDPRVHSDVERHAAIQMQHRNLVLNTREILEGRTTLASTPPGLGIDLHGACNVKPPCVYCDWDSSKELEGQNVDAPFTRETLDEWGPFFDQSVTLTNCSIGEPFMMKNFDDLLDTFGNAGKTLEMTTNGQILTDRNIQKLLGRPIELLISLDAATPLTYSRLRNDTFDRIIGNLRRLIAAKGGKGRPPAVHLVFMPMKCNIDELDAFVQLSADLGVDRMVLRPLNYSDGLTLDWTRAGYHFVYKDELLPFDRLVQASARAARLARTLGVDLDDQMNFGGNLREWFDQSPPPHDAAVLGPADTAATASPDAHDRSLETERSNAEIAAQPPLPSLGDERFPACLEPWRRLYILRRGVLPCCYGCEPIAPMQDYRQAWNSKLMQGIRRALLEGRFHDYCLRSTACPIVRKWEAASMLPLRQRVLMRARHAWWRLNRDTGDVPNKYVYFPVRAFVSGIGRAVRKTIG
jgi:MoaA/NifB/PqqE/SkfB family radical SAM enzyme